MIRKGAPGWFTRQYREIEGHFKWALVLLVGDGIVTIVVTLTHGLLRWQQAALAACFVLLFGWAVAMTARSWRNSSAGNVKRSKSEHASLDEKRLADTARQVVALTSFERFALWQLFLKDTMTGAQLYDIVVGLGFPVLSLQQQHGIQDTFKEMSDKVTFLECAADVWKVKPEFSSYAQCVIEGMSPIFGI